MITVVFDLDGVVYLGDQAVPGAGKTLRALSDSGCQVLFCTNGSASTAEQIARKITRLTDYRVSSGEVATSALAAARYLQNRATQAFVLGGEGIHLALEAAEIQVTADPETAEAVVVGIDKDISYDRLSSAVTAALSSRLLIGTNSDVTYPTPQGLRPGGGTFALAVAAASSLEPVFVGKPYQPILDLLEPLIQHDEVWMVGDRTDTDLALAEKAGWRSLLVFSGVTQPADLEQAVGPAPLTLASIADLSLELLSNSGR